MLLHGALVGLVVPSSPCSDGALARSWSSRPPSLIQFRMKLGWEVRTSSCQETLNSAFSQLFSVFLMTWPSCRILDTSSPAPRILARSLTGFLSFTPWPLTAVPAGTASHLCSFFFFTFLFCFFPRFFVYPPSRPFVASFLFFPDPFYWVRFCFWIGWQGLAVGLRWIAWQCMVDLSGLHLCVVFIHVIRYMDIPLIIPSSSVIPSLGWVGPEQ